MNFLKILKVDFEQLRKAAENGDKNAMLEYAWKLIYHNKLSEAFRWLEMSKDLNDPYALFYLGTCYLFGEGTDINIKEAINCFLRCIELGNIDSVRYIYFCSYYYYDSVNFKEVVRIFEKQNNILSTNNADIVSLFILKFMLACCYYWGKGTEQDKEYAKQLLLSMGYNFDDDETPLLIKEITMADPFQKRNPIYNEFFIPLQKNYFWLDNNKLFSKRYSFLNKFNLSNYSKTKELYEFLKKHNNVDRWSYLRTASEENANRMSDALEENNYHDFRDACFKEPYFAGRVLLYNKLKTNFQDLDNSLFICLKALFWGDDMDSHDLSSSLFMLLLLFFPGSEDAFPEIRNIIVTLIRSINLSRTQFIFACILIQSIINESKIASNLTKSENEKYKELTKILNQPEFSDKIYEFKDCCRNNPSIFKDFEFTKEELSSILGIVEENTEESPDNKIETINAKDVSIPDTYKCITFDGCEKAYKKFFEKLKKIDYIDECTSFESFKIAIGLDKKPEEGIFPRIIWKPVYRSGPYWRPLLNMLRLIGIKREDIKPKIINSLFVHPTGKKIDSNVIKVHKATKEVSFNGEKPISIHKHLCEFLEKSGFPSDKLIHNLDQ